MPEKEKVVLQITDQNTVTITLEEFRGLVGKAARFDAITDSVKQMVDEGKYSKVNDDVVLLMTGTLNYQKPEPATTEGADE
jgi:hypothetical protein